MDLQTQDQSNAKEVLKLSIQFDWYKRLKQISS